MKTKCFHALPFSLTVFLNFTLVYSLFAQGTWQQKANFNPGGRNKATGFAIGSKGYFATGGSQAGGPQQDLWEWDQSTDYWTQKANFPGGVRVLAVGFSIGTKGYIGTGNDGGPTNYSDFWEYDPATNQWTSKAAFGGGIRQSAVGFSVGSKGYIGSGWDGTTYKNDLWEFDPAGNTWTARTNFPGAARAGAAAFTIGSKGYVGTGNANTTYYQDLWEFDPAGNTWLQKAGMPGLSRSLAAAFSIGTKGYIGTGTDGAALIGDLWEWDQALNAWNPVTPFPGIGRTYAVGLSIGNLGYFGCGFNVSPLQDFYQYTPPLKAVITASANVTCNGAADGSATVTASGGNPPYNYFWSNEQFSSTTTGLSGNTYTVIVTDVSQNNVSAVVTINEPAAMSVYSIPSYINPATCGNANGNVNYVIQGGVPPYSYLWSNGMTTQLISGLTAGLYRMNITDANGCFSFADALVPNSNGPTVTVSNITPVSCNGMSNGAVSITVSGGSPPYAYNWSNGATSQNITGLSYGPYDVEVKDASGCLAQKTATVNEPPALAASVSVVNSSCNNANGSAKVTPAGGTSPYTYAWSTGATHDSISLLTANIYTVLVTDSRNCKVTGWAPVSDTINPYVILDSVTAVICGNLGSAYITPFDPVNIQSYLWTNGWTTQDLSGVAAGQYGCLVTDLSGCKNAWLVSVPPVMPPLKPICLVTVDTTSNMNIVVWEKPAGASSISGFNVYRESSVQGTYQRIGFTPWASLSLYNDTVPDPDNRWARYKVSMVDVCGHEGPLSAEHKTIHLSVPSVTAQGAHLIWDDYEGNPFSYYYISRKVNFNGNWAIIDSVAAGTHVYTDNTLSTGDTAYYHVDVKNAGGCNATLKGMDLLATNLNTSRSNVYRIRDTTVVAVNFLSGIQSQVSIFPNPSNGSFVIASDADQSLITICNIFGEKVYSRTANSRREKVNLDAPNGVYFIRVRTDKGTTARKIVLQR